jgi:hypothetical protein
MEESNDLLIGGYITDDTPGKSLFTPSAGVGTRFPPNAGRVTMQLITPITRAVSPDYREVS